MTTKEDIKKYVQNYQKFHETPLVPIFEILLIEKPHEELVSATGQKLGWPDVGASNIAGFYYNLDHAVADLEKNMCDIHERTYHAGFVLCHFPGLYKTVGPEARMYFKWNMDKQKYVQAEEPKIFARVTY